MQKDKKYYDEFFTQHPVSVHANPSRFMAVCELISGKVLDVACGTGTLSDYYVGDYVGVDISTVAIDKAKSVRRKTARFLQADFSKDAFIVNEKYDSAYLGEFLEHIENDDIVFKNLVDVLKPDGCIVVTVPNGNRIKDESHCRIFTVPEIRKNYSKYGKLTFHNWSGFRDRILFTIDLGSENQDIISLVMIAKDEGKGIENAILSALPLVDRVVVSVDTKTTDNTADIAKLYADELRTHEWHDHFANTRNEAQTNVKSKWILFLDGHEYIEKTGAIENMLMLDVDGILITIKMENGTTFMYPRIFKNGLQFENAVHNAIDCKTIQHAPKFVIVHDRGNAQSIESSKAREKQRDRMIPKLMKERLKDFPKDQRALFNLGNWYMTKSQYRQAIPIYERCLKYTPSPDEKYFVLAQIGICHQMLGHNLRATWTFFDLEKLIPNRWETKRLIGGIYLQRGQFEKALPFLVHALGRNEKQYLYQLFGQDYAELWDLIAHCFSEVNEPARAIVSWREAIKNTDEQLRKNFFQTKIELCELLLKGKV